MRKVELTGIPLLAWRDIRVGHCSERYDDSYLDLYPDLAVFLTHFLRAVRRTAVDFLGFQMYVSALLQVQCFGLRTMAFYQRHVWDTIQVDDHNSLLSETKSLAPTLILDARRG